MGKLGWYYKHDGVLTVETCFELSSNRKSIHGVWPQYQGFSMSFSCLSASSQNLRLDTMDKSTYLSSHRLEKYTLAETVQVCVLEAK